MAFDLSTAKPLGGFDISSAKPLGEWEDNSPLPTYDDSSLADKTNAALSNLGGGAIRGAGTIGSTLLWPIDAATDYIKGDREQNIADLVTGNKPLSRHQERVLGMDEALKTMGADPESNYYKGGKLASEIAGTAGAGGLVAAPVRAIAGGSPAAARLAAAIESGGMALPSGGNLLTNAGLRATGGAVAGGTGAALIDPSQIKTGAALGAALPFPLKAAGSALAGAKTLVSPLTESGQRYTLGNMLEDFSHNPEQARAALNAAPEQFPSGALPTTAESSGDIGLAGLTRGMQSSDPVFGNNLASRFYEQNAARSNMLDDISGNNGKISAAQAERDAATSAMREQALDSAGHVDSNAITSQIDSLINDPNNAGKLSQQALNGVKSQLQQFTDESGNISARAVYAIRKDINDIIGGKLQGDQGNLRQAAGQLKAVKNIFDNTIESALARGSNSTELATTTAGREVNPLNIGPSEYAAQNNPSFKEYLRTYSEMSKPISQMEKLQDVTKKIQNGTIDTNGNAILSSAKLNNVLKNSGDDLAKELNPQQMQTLRNLAGELNASTMGITAGKSIGSNTAQNYIIDKAINDTIGKIGLGEVGKNTIGGIGKAIYSRANESIMRQLGDALLDPKQAAKLMNESQLKKEINRKLALALQNTAKPLPAASTSANNQ